jgi:hypothetical protein
MYADEPVYSNSNLYFHTQRCNIQHTDFMTKQIEQQETLTMPQR